MTRIAWSMLAAALVAVALAGCAYHADCAPVAQNSGAPVCVPVLSNDGSYDPNMHGNYPD